MSSAAQTSELDGLGIASKPAKKTRGVFISFASFVVIGLGLAGWYVSERILSAQSQPPVPAEQIKQQVPAPTAPVVAAASQAPVSSAPAASEVLHPLALEYYLQVAALGGSEDARFLKQLQDKGYNAQFDAAAADHDARILIGPYADESALKQARQKLMAAGILAIDYVR